VHRNDRLGPRRKAALDFGRVDVCSLGVDVREDWPGAGERDAVGRRKKGNRRSDRFVTGAESSRQRGNVQPGRGVGDGYAVFCAGIGAYRLLKRLDGRAASEIVAAQDV